MFEFDEIVRRKDLTKKSKIIMTKDSYRKYKIYFCISDIVVSTSNRFNSSTKAFEFWDLVTKRLKK